MSEKREELLQQLSKAESEASSFHYKLYEAQQRLIDDMTDIRVGDTVLTGEKRWKVVSRSLHGLNFVVLRVRRVNRSGEMGKTTRKLWTEEVVKEVA